MSRNRLAAFLSIAASSLALSACGGGSGGGNVGSIPAPPEAPAPAPAPAPTPAPTPPPTSAGALAAPPSAVTATTEFTAAGDPIGIRWNSDLKAYELTLPSVGSGKVEQAAWGPFGATGSLVGSNGSKIASVFAFTPHQYTGIMEASGPGTRSFTAFGVATPQGGVPTMGTASYSADIAGLAGSWILSGSALLQFDFAAGKLSGYMDPVTNGPMGSPTLPRYTFAQTVFSPGSTTFSGAFDIVGPTSSSFQGQFTGPDAQELMASFKAPFLDWDSAGLPNVWNEMHGVIVGKRN